MIDWIKLDAGEYESSNHRFYIIKDYDRIYGDHWLLQDRNVPDYYKGQYHEDTLRDCKGVAETILREEKCEKECICNSKEGCIREDLEVTIPTGPLPCDEKEYASEDKNYTAKIDEIIELAKFHGFDVEYSYPDGEKGTEKAVPISELRIILHEVLMPEENESDN